MAICDVLARCCCWWQAASADRLADIKARGTLIVGVSTAIPPFTFQRGSEIVGYRRRPRARRRAADGRHSWNWCPVSETERIKAVQDGKIDLIASTFTRTPERERDVAFSLDIFNSPQVMIVDRASGLTSVKQMNGRTFGVLKGRTSDQNIREVVPTAQLRLSRRLRERLCRPAEQDVRCICGGQSGAADQPDQGEGRRSLPLHCGLLKAEERRIRHAEK